VSDDTKEYLLLKWGTLKGWNAGENEAYREALHRYFDQPTSMGAMSQRDTPEQKRAIFDMIDACNGPITNDWSGEDYTKEQAKEYIANYGKRDAA
jgi:hypothetical protein